MTACAHFIGSWGAVGTVRYGSKLHAVLIEGREVCQTSKELLDRDQGLPGNYRIEAKF